MIYLKNGSKASVVLTPELFEPQFSFDPDNRTLRIRNTDFRDDPNISYTLGGSSRSIESDILTPYSLALINQEYTISYTITPTNTNLTGKTYTKKIFMNDENCKYFRYTGDNYKSTNIGGYTGTNSNIVIPVKHNLTDTLTASIHTFPNVISDKIDITTPYFMNSFSIKENRIRSFNILSPNFKPADNQFSNMPNLETITFASYPVSASNYMFYNDTKLNADPSTFKNMTNFGVYAFYNTPNQKRIRIAADNIETGVFDYSNTGTKKVIFTSANSINGLTNDDLIDGTYTKGMLYGVNKKHEFYCGITDSVWKENSAKKDTVNIFYDVKNKRFQFKPDDTNIFGLKVEVESALSNKKIQRVFSGNTFNISDSELYGTNMTNTDTLENEFGIFSKVSFDDRFKITAIDNTGALSTITKTPYGDIAPAPNYRLRRLFYTANVQDESIVKTYTVNGVSFSVSIPANTTYEYILCDKYNKNIFMVHRRYSTNAVLLGLNGQGFQTPELHLEVDFGDYALYRINMNDYYDFDEYREGDGSVYWETIYYYREYKYGYINEDRVYGTTSNRTPEFLVNPTDEYDNWYDIWMTNGDPDFAPKRIFWTTADNSTLTYNGETYATNVPKYRAYFKYDGENCPVMKVRMNLVETYDDNGSTKYRIRVIETNKIVSGNIVYVDLLDYGTEEEIRNWVYTTYNKYSPSIDVGYADTNLGTGFLRYVSFSYLNTGAFGDGSFKSAKLDYTEEV